MRKKRIIKKARKPSCEAKAPGRPVTRYTAPVSGNGPITPRVGGTSVVAASGLGSSVIEVGSYRAAQLLGMSQSALRAARESRLGRHHLRWRFTSETQRIIAWEVPSLAAYKEATRTLGK